MFVRSYHTAAARARQEEGFTMIAVMLVTVVVTLLAGAALWASTLDARLVGNDLDQKQAYLAAKTGVEEYQLDLNQDPNYWSYCRSPSGVSPGVPTASWAVSPIPATGQTACDPNNPVTTMIEAGSGAVRGTFRVRSTGTVTDGGNTVSRTIIATFQRRSFLDFIYYTQYETLDPSAYQNEDDREAAASACNVYYYNGRPLPGGQNYCSQIYFNTGDSVNGPLHTNDTLAICGSPILGRTGKNDTVETSAPSPGYSTEGNSCTSSPKFNTQNGKLSTGVPLLIPPPTNAQLKQITASNYQFTGQTHIQLAGSTMTVTNANVNSGQPYSLPFPANGVVYVSSSSCPYDSTSSVSTYIPFGVTYTQANGWAYSGASGCGTLTIDGSYNSSLTLASDNDVVIDGSITRGSSGALLGLIGQNYVRIYRPCGQSLSPGTLSSPQINAAILALTGSFIVDNYNCSGALGNLNVTGAIAQIYRGPVGTFGGQNGTTGYLKNYVYDDNLRSLEPPHFIEPVAAAWHTERQTECNGSGC